MTNSRFQNDIYQQESRLRVSVFEARRLLDDHLPLSRRRRSRGRSERWLAERRMFTSRSTAMSCEKIRRRAANSWDVLDESKSIAKYNEIDRSAKVFATRPCEIISDLPWSRKRRDHDNMMWKAKWSRFTECFCRRPGLVLVLLPCLIVVTLYLVSSDEYEYDVLQYPSFKSYNVAEGESLIPSYRVLSIHHSNSCISVFMYR